MYRDASDVRTISHRLDSTAGAGGASTFDNIVECAELGCVGAELSQASWCATVSCLPALCKIELCQTSRCSVRHPISGTRAKPALSRYASPRRLRVCYNIKARAGGRVCNLKVTQPGALWVDAERLAAVHERRLVVGLLPAKHARHVSGLLSKHRHDTPRSAVTRSLSRTLSFSVCQIRQAIPRSRQGGAAQANAERVPAATERGPSETQYSCCPLQGTLVCFRNAFNCLAKAATLAHEGFDVCARGVNEKGIMKTKILEHGACARHALL